MKRSFVMVVLMVAALAAVPARAGTIDSLVCQVDVAVRLSEGLRLGVPFQSGTITTPTPGSARCSGVIDGVSVDGAAGSLHLTGTFGDGPLSAPTGGATCSHNDGYLEGELTLDVGGHVARIALSDFYWVRSATAVVNAVGSTGGASTTANGVITQRDGRCTSDQPIHTAQIAMAIAAAGDITTER